MPLSKEIIPKKKAPVQHGKPLPIGKAPKAKKIAKPKVSSSVATGETGEFTGYCVKCKEKDASFKGEVYENPKNGRRMAKGPHKCGTTVCRILGKQ